MQVACPLPPMKVRSPACVRPRLGRKNSAPILGPVGSAWGQKAAQGVLTLLDQHMEQHETGLRWAARPC